MNIFTMRKVMPKAPAKWLEALCLGCLKWDINTQVRFAAFAGHLAHECDQFTRLEENLRYSAERLTKVWPKRFPTLDDAAPYAYSPQKLANKVYANRLGNRDEVSGDGWEYRGRGPIQTTGFTNYKRTGEAIGVDLVAAPDKLLVPEIGIAAAGFFWKLHGLNELADEGTDGVVTGVLSSTEMDDELAVTRAINGGTTGYNDRVNWINAIRAQMVKDRL